MEDVKIVVSNLIKIKISDIPSEVFTELMKVCTYDNPEFINKLANGKKVIGIPRFLRTCKVEDEQILIPRGKINTVKEIFAQFNLKCKFVDFRVTNFFQKEVHFKSTMKLFPYQEKAKDSLVSFTQRLLSADCGAGKTVIACGIIDSIQQKTLIAVDTTELLEQWKQEITKFLNIDFEVGSIGAGKYDVKPITVALVQSLHTMNNEEWRLLNENFGCMIFDEVQGLPAPTRFELLTKFAGKYLYGLSATIQRADGLEFFTYDSISPSIVEIDQAELKAANRFLNVDLEFIKCTTIKNTPREFGNLNWNKLLDRIVTNDERNSVIANDIAMMVRLGHKSIVLSARVEHCKLLVELVTALGVKAKVFTGDVDKDDRQDIRGEIEDGNVDCIIATYQIAQKGLNIPHLSCLHLPLPIKDKNILQQATGRIRRVKSEKIKPMVRDYVDFNAPILKKKAKNRASIYQELGYIQIKNAQDLFTSKKIRL